MVLEIIHQTPEWRTVEKKISANEIISVKLYTDSLPAINFQSYEQPFSSSLKSSKKNDELNPVQRPAFLYTSEREWAMKSVLDKLIKPELTVYLPLKATARQSTLKFGAGE